MVNIFYEGLTLTLMKQVDHLLKYVFTVYNLATRHLALELVLNPGFKLYWAFNLHFEVNKHRDSFAIRDSTWFGLYTHFFPHT